VQEHFNPLNNHIAKFKDISCIYSWA